MLFSKLKLQRKNSSALQLFKDPYLILSYPQGQVEYKQAPISRALKIFFKSYCLKLSMSC